MPHFSPRGLIFVVLATLALSLPAWAYPEPAIVNPSWAIDFEFQTPDAVAVTDEDGQVKWYWYLPYTVTNHSGDDQLFIPEFVIYEDAGAIRRAGQGIPTSVFPLIAQRLKNPLLKNPVEIVGKLLQGDDFAKQGVAIWPAPDVDVDTLRLFVGGLYGETQTVHDPKTHEPTLLRRTVMLEFTTPGNFKTPQDQPVEMTLRQDVMR